MNAALRDRWLTSEGKALTAVVWKRLVAGEELRDLPLNKHEGRIDLRGISVPQVTKEDLPGFHAWRLRKLTGQLVFRNVSFEGIDFTNSCLADAQFFHSRISDCCFNEADLSALGVRATDMTRSSFVNTNLRDSVLGPWYEGRGNLYTFVDFRGADMRGLISSSATFVDCDFSQARLDKIDFQSSSFIRCRFAGEVREVLFYAKTFDTKKDTPNPMEDVDFSGAKLHWVEFRGLNLNRVRFPQDNDHRVIKHYPCVLEKVLNALRGDESQQGRRLRSILQLERKWLGPEQEIGLARLLDFRERWGEEGERFALDLLLQAERECSRTE